MCWWHRQRHVHFVNAFERLASDDRLLFMLGMPCLYVARQSVNKELRSAVEGFRSAVEGVGELVGPCAVSNLLTSTFGQTSSVIAPLPGALHA
jgi:hypothetical protein